MQKALQIANGSASQLTIFRICKDTEDFVNSVVYQYISHNRFIHLFVQSLVDVVCYFFICGGGGRKKENRMSVVLNPCRKLHCVIVACLRSRIWAVQKSSMCRWLLIDVKGKQKPFHACNEASFVWNFHQNLFLETLGVCLVVWRARNA